MSLDRFPPNSGFSQGPSPDRLPGFDSPDLAAKPLPPFLPDHFRGCIERTLRGRPLAPSTGPGHELLDRGYKKGQNDFLTPSRSRRTLKGPRERSPRLALWPRWGL